MTLLNGAPRRAVIALGAILCLAVPASTQAPGRLPALAKLQPGLWHVKEVGNPRAAPKPVCVGDPNILLQIQHRNSPCTRLVISNQDKEATVHYTCPASGFGRTTIKVESPRLAVIDTQGIVGKVPFAYRAEARRIGTCSTGRSARR